ncbi:hypothetical protein SLE2022_181360 [Rubroshorea leprosula]
MEMVGMDWEQGSLLNELTQGKDLATELQIHLNPPSSTETRLFLVEKILCSYEKALSMLNSGAFSGMLEAQPSAANSTLDSSDLKDISKKRKIMSTWTKRVRVCSGSSPDVPLDDGYSWRKYGQKVILGTNHPRGYYRCTHRHSQGCVATKQVQRSDEDPTLFELTYRGRHTCMGSSRLVAAAAAVATAPSVEEYPKEKPELPEGVVLNFETELQVKAESLDSMEEIFPSFAFPYASAISEEVGNDIFPESMVDNNLMGSFSPAFISPATSESDYFSVSPCDMGSFGIRQSSESDLAEIISGPLASVPNSPIGDFDFTVLLDTSFSFDSLDCLS